MAWSTTTWTPGNIQQYADEFFLALNERSGLFPDELWEYQYEALNPGTAIQQYNLWWGLQHMIEYIAQYFTISHENGIEKSTPALIQQINGYETLADVFAATDLPHSNWRRYTTHPNDGGTVQYGRVQAGDIMGPWVFEDIQKCLNVLVWTTAGTNSVPGMSYVHTANFVDGVNYSGYGLDERTYTAAKAGAIADWGLSTSTYYHVMAYSHAHGQYLNYYGRWDWDADIRHSDAKIQVTGLSAGVMREAIFYIWPISLYGYDFDDNGYGFTRDEYNMVGSPKTGDGETITSDLSGTDTATMPNWIEDPPPGQGGAWGLGFGTSFAAAILKWNVAGGFEYA